MQEFFKGWKRKVGCLTLVVASMTAACWIRSLTTDDWIELTADESFVEIGISSFQGTVTLQVCILAPNKPTKWKFPTWSIIRVHGESPEHDQMKWHFRWCEFAIGREAETRFHPEGRLELYIVPYWAIVTPLTLLSAYLLLSRSRPSIRLPASP